MQHTWMSGLVQHNYRRVLEVIEHSIGSIRHIEPEKRVAVSVEFTQTLHRHSHSQNHSQREIITKQGKEREKERLM